MGYVCFFKVVGQSEIRTRDSVCYNAFQKHRFKPLSHLPDERYITNVIVLSFQRKRPPYCPTA